MPGVAECALVGMPDERWGEVPVLILVMRAGCAAPTKAAVHAALEGAVARFKWPRALTVLPSLPRTALGKVRRGHLVARLGDMAWPQG